MTSLLKSYAKRRQRQDTRKIALDPDVKGVHRRRFDLHAPEHHFERHDGQGLPGQLD
jgi:hypothetical protein